MPHSLARARVEQQLAHLATAEIEHVGDRIRNRVEGSLADALSAEPVVLDEAENRRLIRGRVIDEVLPGPRRDDDQRDAWSESATPLRVQRAGRHPRKGRRTVPACARTGQTVGAGS